MENLKATEVPIYLIVLLFFSLSIFNLSLYYEISRSTEVFQKSVTQEYFNMLQICLEIEDAAKYKSCMIDVEIFLKNISTVDTVNVGGLR